MALVLSFGFFGTANADAPSIIENGVEEINSYANCYMAPDNMSPVAASIDAGEWVTTLESDVPGWRFLAYGDGYCWVWSELVGSLPNQVAQEPIAPESSFDGTLEVIGQNTVNADGVNCRELPSATSAAVTTFNTNDVVTELADGNPDGWQMIALEAQPCFINAEFLGIDISEITVTSSEVPATTVPAVTTVPTVTTLPSTGSGPIYSIDLGVDGVGSKPELTEAQEMSAWIVPAGIVAFIGIIVAIRWYDVRHEKHVNSL